ncbi:hypothetical protein VT03_15685 [Planctomyces sp. SH-PL14]|nr:hypothetical protein VT03_15685 [Planctomyces sp. SH-PL14]
MLRLRSRLLAGAATLGAACGAVPAFGQWFGGSSCGCAQPVAMAPAPVVTSACCAPPQPIACMTPVQQTVYREMPVTEYRTVQKTEKVPVVKVAYEDRPVTAYRQVMETKTASVPSYDYQTVAENRVQTVNQSYWRTNWQPIAKCEPCQYDPRPGFMGSMNRLGVQMRNAMTPSYIPRREFVPNVVAYNVPTQRTVAIPTTRQVAYNVARMEPYQSTERVAVQRVEYEDRTVTALEPFTTTRTVAVGTQTQYAWSGVGVGGTMTAFGYLPTTTALAPLATGQTAAAPQPTPAGSNPVKLQSYERPVDDRGLQTVPVRPLNGRLPEQQPGKEPAVAGNGWRSYRGRDGQVDPAAAPANPIVRRAAPPAPVQGPILSVAAN